jgi:hypothetical protein
VAFTCPVYGIADAGGGFVLYGGPKDYGVSFSQSSTLGPDGRLTDPVALNQAKETPPTGSGQCSSALAAGGSQRPQETPGTYYWQPYRICTDCPLGYEVGPTRRLVVRANGSAKLRPPGRVFAGYPFALAISLPGVPNFAPVRIERKAGRKWKRVATTSALSEKAEAVVVLKRGRHTLRVVATVGADVVTSAGKRITVRRPAGWKTSGKDDGSYRGQAPTVKFKVTGGGRTIKGFSASVAMLCPGVQPGQFTTEIGTAAVRKIKIAPDGSFLAAARPDRVTSLLVRGRLHRGATKGRVKLSVRVCSGDLAFKARR